MSVADGIMPVAITFLLTMDYSGDRHAGDPGHGGSLHGGQRLRDP